MHSNLHRPKLLRLVWAIPAFSMALAAPVSAAPSEQWHRQNSQLMLETMFKSCEKGLAPGADASTVEVAEHEFKRNLKELERQSPNRALWPSTVRSHDVQPFLARCQTELPQLLASQVAKEEQHKASARAARDLEEASQAGESAAQHCEWLLNRAYPSEDGHDYQQYQSFKQRALQLAAGRPFRVKGMDGPKHFAECDARISKAIVEAKVQAEAQSAKLAKQAADNRARYERIVASLKGDRATLFQQRGAPDEPLLAALPTASVWKYRDEVDMGSIRQGNNEVTATSWCNVAYSFRGSKKTGVKKVGPGCKYHDAP